MPKVSNSKEETIEKIARQLIIRWLKWIGFANLLMLATALAFALFVLPERAVHQALSMIRAEIASTIDDLRIRTNESFVTLGKAKENLTDLERRSADSSSTLKKLRSKIDELSSDLSGLSNEDFAHAAVLVRELEKSPNSVSILTRLSEINTQLNSLPSGIVGSIEFFGHRETMRSEGVRAPDDDSAMCPSEEYMCGLRYDHFEGDLTIEPICCKLATPR